MGAEFYTVERRAREGGVKALTGVGREGICAKRGIVTEQVNKFDASEPTVAGMNN